MLCQAQGRAPLGEPKVRARPLLSPPWPLWAGQHAGKTAGRFFPKPSSCSARPETKGGLHCAMGTRPWGLWHTREREVPRALWMLLLLEHSVLLLGQGSREISGPSGGAETLVGAVRSSGEELHPGAILCCSCSGESPGGSEASSFCQGALHSQASSSSGCTVCPPQAGCHHLPVHTSLCGLSALGRAHNELMANQPLGH